MEKKRGFTLIELLVVIAVIAILAVVVILTLNPAALLQQSRDANRVSDMSTLTDALGLYSEDVGGSMGVASTTYVSIPDPLATSTAGDQCQGLGLPALPTGDVYQCASSSTYRNINGTGWIPINFNAITYKTPFSVLPIDPVNTTSTGYFYTYTTDGTHYELTHIMESTKYASTCANDGGQYSDLCESGTSLTLAAWDYYANNNPYYFAVNTSKSFSGSATTTYTFNGTSGEVISLGVSGINSCSSRYSILNPGGSTLSSNNSCSGILSLSNLNLASNGIYSVVVSPYGTENNTLSLSTNLTGTIPLNSSTTVSSAVVGQSVAYTFSGTASETIDFGISGVANCSTQYYLLNPNGSTLVNNNSCGSSLVFTNEVLATSGTYTFSVAPYNSIGTLSLTLSNPETGTIVYNTPVNVSSTLFGQTAAYTFSGTANQVVSFTANNDNGCSTEYYILNPNGSTLTSGFSCGYIVTISSTTLPTTGTYTVSIVPDAPFSSTWTLSH